MQQQYWQLLCDLRSHCFYLSEHRLWTHKFDNWVGIVLAVASSTSIAAWAIWQAYPMLWAGVIALSQVILAVRPFLPGKKLLQCIQTLQNEVERLAIQVESDWYQVANGSLSEAEINEKIRVIRLNLHEAQVRCFDEAALPENPKYLAVADQKAIAYLSANYPIPTTS